MFVSIDWIKEYVDLSDIEKKDLVEKYTLGTAEIENVEESNKHLSDIRIVQITNIEKHPEADKLNLVTFKVSEGESFRVVCGASNVREGLKVPYAKIGTTLPGGFTLVPKKIRGILSEGMLCSGEELGVHSEIDGLLELPEDAPIGQTMSDFLGQKPDIIFDIDNKSLTHRPDLWGHYGQAREFSALFERPLKPFISTPGNLPKVDNKGKIKVTLDSASSGISYFGLSIDNIEVTESPSWLKRRLESVGLNSKNSIVDISNFVMLDLGLPNHIFDADKIQGNISINRLDAAHDFTTLDGEKRSLQSGDTVVCDESGPLVIAGIMGGESSGVSENTKNIFIEVACWKASEVRATSTRLGLRTDSSQRFEKSIDPKLGLQALEKIVQLVRELNPKCVVDTSVNYDGLKLESIDDLIIETSIEKINNVLGTKFSDLEILNIFKSLDFKLISQTDSSISLQVPSFRSTKDVECEADLIEEIGRIKGYGSIEAKAPVSPIFPVKLDPFKALLRRARGFLSQNIGAFEVYTYPLVGDEKKSFSYPQKKDIDLINYLSEDNRYMRDNLVNSILEKVSSNSKHEESFNLFETGKVYEPSKSDFVSESYSLVLASFTKTKNYSPFTDLVNKSEALFKFLNLPYSLETRNNKFNNTSVNQDWEYLHPVEFLNVKMMGTLEGAIFSIHPVLLKNKKIKGSVSVMVISLAKLQKRPLKKKQKFAEIPKFPRSSFDCSVVLHKSNSVRDILDVFKKFKEHEFAGATIKDIYDQGDETSSVTLSVEFVSTEKTIDSNRLKELEANVVTILEKNNYFLKK